MRGRLRLVMAVGSVALAGWHPASAQRTGQVPRAEAGALSDLVDRVAAGKPARGDAYLHWDSHVMWAADGLVYVPFSLTLDDVAGAFESIALYVRVVPRGSSASAPPVRASGSDIGVAVSVPERQFSHGSPTAGEASARLGLMASEISGVKTPYEGFFVADHLKGASPVVRRSFVVAPGSYDLYVAVRERLNTRAAPKVAVLQSSITVPNLTGSDLTMSSIILAERVETLGRRLSPTQRIERPYAFNLTEVIPVSSARFEPDDVLSIVFFVYNLAVNGADQPDVTVAYRFLRMSELGIFGEMAPQRFSRNHIPPQFDVKAGRQLAVTQALPLASFPPDTYELEIAVTDNVSGRSLVRAVRFTVE